MFYSDIDVESAHTVKRSKFVASNSVLVASSHMFVADSALRFRCECKALVRKSWMWMLSMPKLMIPLMLIVFMLRVLVFLSLILLSSVPLMNNESMCMCVIF